VKALIIGCGRVGSTVATQLDGSGWDVTVLDQDEDALARLGDHWTGGFVVAHAMDIRLLREAGIEEADAVVVATNGDNTNLVVAQVAQQQFQVPTVVARILDPGRAQFYAARGLRIVCPTAAAIETLVEAVRAMERTQAA
jgi:trk system potassium uptake protein TrkA